MKISASVYVSRGKSLRETVRQLDEHGIDFFHIDCEDNTAVFEDIAEIRKISRKPVDLHIISPDPGKFFPLLEKHNVEYASFQYENLPDGLNPPAHLSSRLGLAVTSATDTEVFDKYSEICSFILFMATIPGKSGGQFNKDIFRKIRAFRKKYPDKKIHVDGGVNGEVSFILRNMGVFAAVSGSYLFQSAHLGAALLNLKSHEVESHYRVKDFMLTREEIPVLNPSQRSFGEVLHALENFKLGFIILEGGEGILEGIISNADVRKGLLRHLDNLNAAAVNDMINTAPVTVNENDTVEEMLRKIKAQRFPINFLPVINDARRVTGALTFFNLIKGEL